MSEYPGWVVADALGSHEARARVPRPQAGSSVSARSPPLPQRSPRFSEVQFMLAWIVDLYAIDARAADMRDRARRVAARAHENEPNLATTTATPAGFEPDIGPNRFADLQNRIKKLRVPLGAVGIAWGHRKAVEMGP
jgi:hypothetical protein